MDVQQTPVLVIGGSVVGLSAAMFLAWRGVPVVMVERHAGSSPHPRAIGYPARTMELFRAAGIADAIPQTPPSFRLRRARVESLAGTWLDESSWTPEKKAGQKEGQNDVPKDPPREASIDQYSPVTGAAIAQDALEPIIRDRARALGADLRLGHELLHFEQDADGVTATVRERNGGREYQVRAQYMVAADGNNSPVREALKIGRKGRGLMRVVRSVLFRAPLQEYLKSGVMQWEIEQPDLRAFLTTYQDGRWVLMFTDDVERDPATLDAEIHKAIGRTDVPAEIITTGRWELSALVDDRFSEGRVFLAGDAAHTLPPTRGGFGANTGIHDASNLAWKLEAVLAGTSTPQLLDTYDAERRPVALVRHDQIFVRPDYARDAQGFGAGVPILDDIALELGQIYRSTAVLDANGAPPSDSLPDARRPDEWAGQPGTRAPHAWILDVRNGRGRISTLDLFQRGWVLLAADARWCPSATQVGERLGITLDCLHLGVDVAPAEGADRPRVDLPAMFGIGAAGASLIRPDGYIAWRSTDLPADPTSVLFDALRTAFSAPVGDAVGGR